MPYSVKINATLATLALDSSAIGGFETCVPYAVTVQAGPPLSPAPSEQTTVAYQIQKFRSRRSKEDERKQKVLAKLPGGWLRDRKLPPEPQPSEFTGPEPAAVYRRVSTPEQKEAAMDRQAGVESYAHRINTYIAFVYDDKGKSGRFRAGRPDLLRMMKDAKAGKFKKLILETGNRLARDLGLTTSVFRDLRRWGVEIHTPAEGKWHLVHAAFNGLMGQEALENLKMWIRAGTERAVLDGKYPSAAPYGFYKKPGYPGELFENEEEAKHVKWMYSMRSVGISPAEIRRHLNEKGILSRKGKKWSTVQVSKILRDPIYIGLIIYFRTKHEKTESDAYTIIRKITKTPMSAWRLSERPDWALVETDIWNKVQQLDVRHSRSWNRPATRLLTGILSCAECGSPMHSHDRSWEHVRIHCSDAKRKNEDANSKSDSQPCQKRNSVLLQCVEIVTVTAAAERVATVGAVTVAEQAYNSAVAREFADKEKDRHRIKAEIKGIIDQIKATFEAAYTQSIPEKTIELLRQGYNESLEKKKLELAALPIPAMPERPLESVDFSELAGFLQDFPYCKDFNGADERETRLMSAFQELVSSVEVEALSARSFNLTIHGPLANIGARPGDSNPTIRIEARNVELKVPKGSAKQPPIRWNRISVPDSRINDAEWALMAALLPREPIWIEGYPKAIEIRDVMDFLLLQRRSNIKVCDLHHCPSMTSQWEHPPLVLRAAREIANFWNVIDLFADIASKHAPRLIEGINIRLKGRRSSDIDDIPAAFDRRNSLMKARALDPNAVLSLPKRYMTEHPLS